MLWQGLREEQIGRDVKCCVLWRYYYFCYPLPVSPPTVLLLSPFCSQHLNQKERKILSTNSHLTWAGGCPSYNLWKLKISPDPVPSKVSKQCNETINIFFMRLGIPVILIPHLQYKRTFWKSIFILPLYGFYMIFYIFFLSWTVWGL